MSLENTECRFGRVEFLTRYKLVTVFPRNTWHPWGEVIRLVNRALQLFAEFNRNVLRVIATLRVVSGWRL
jgi:hypothetical protein